MIRHQPDSDFEGEAQYSFVPGLLHEIVYNEIPEPLRAPYHRLAGQWLELMAQRRNSDINIEIAHHFDLGGEEAHAAHYHIDIGIRSLKMYATQRAIVHLEKGLQHLDPFLVQKRVRGLRQLAEAYILNGQYEEAIARFQELLKISWQMGQRVMAGEAYIRIGWIYYLMRDFEKALSAMKNGHTMHQEIMHQRGIATALSNMGSVYQVMGDYSRARLYFQESLEIRRELGHPGDLAWALNNMGNLLIDQGELAEAQRLHTEALEIRKSLGNPHLIIRSMNNLALIHIIRGDYDAALADLLVSSNLAQKIGEKLGMSIITCNIGELYLLRGEIEKADKYLQQAMQLAERLGVRLRSRVVLTFQDLSGNITSAAFRVTGLFDTDNNAFDESTALVRREDLNRVLGREGIAHELAILLEDASLADTVAARLRSRMPGLDVQTYMQLSPEIRLFESQIATSVYIIMVIVMLGLIFGIINTMLMAVLERVRELGMLMAIGMNKVRVFFMIMLETLMLGVVGAPLGILIGAVMIHYYKDQGLDLSQYAREGFSEFGMSAIIYPDVYPGMYVELAIAVFITALLASIYPALKAIRLRPVEALRKI